MRMGIIWARGFKGGWELNVRGYKWGGVLNGGVVCGWICVREIVRVEIVVERLTRF